MNEAGNCLAPAVLEIMFFWVALVRAAEVETKEEEWGAATCEDEMRAEGESIDRVLPDLRWMKDFPFCRAWYFLINSVPKNISQQEANPFASVKTNLSYRIFKTGSQIFVLKRYCRTKKRGRRK